MATFYIDDRVSGANNGGAGDDAWQSIADISGLSLGDVLEFVEGSGPYQVSSAWTLERNGASGNPMVMNFNGCVLTASVNASTLKWTLSSSGTNEYYLTTTGDTDPNLANCESLTINNHYRTLSAADADRTFGTVGSLAALQPGIGDNDSLGFNTIYIRFPDGNPTEYQVTLGTGNYIIDTNWGYQQFNNARFEFGKPAAVRNRGVGWEFNDCVFSYASDTGVELSHSTSSVTLARSHGYWSGHRLAYVAAAGADLVMDSCIDWGAHLLLLVAASADATNTISVTGCISANNEAGVFDIQSATANFTETDNHFWPRCTAPGGGLGYNATDDSIWTVTDASDNPSSTDTSLADQYQMVAPGFTRFPGPSDPYDASDFVLANGAYRRGRGRSMYLRGR